MEVALVGLVLALAAPVVEELKTQQASRLALTAAIWDDQSLEIDAYPVGVDRAERGGHVYSDKAPGQPLFAVPAYGAYRILGGERATVRRLEGNLGLWATKLWSSVLPAAALAVLVRRAAARARPTAATAATVMIAVGTLLLPFSTLLFGHVLGAALAFGAWYLLSGGGLTDRRLLTAGALLGAAVLTEYTLVLVAAVLLLQAGHAVGRRAGWVLVGAVPAGGLLLAYQWAAFGSPWSFSYARSSFGSVARDLGDQDQDPSVLGNAVEVLVGERGLLVVTPILALAVAGLFVLIRESRGPARAAYLSAAASAGALVGVQVLWSNPTGGDSPGARYATAAAAFLAPGATVAWERWRRPTVVLAALSALVMLAATWTEPLEARDSTGAIGIWLRRLGDGDWTDTIYAMGLGGWATVLLPAGGAAALLWVHRAEAGAR